MQWLDDTATSTCSSLRYSFVMPEDRERLLTTPARSLWSQDGDILGGAHLSRHGTLLLPQLRHHFRALSRAVNQLAL
jgi:hypothetical protein